uniref:Uncharacterized protein n=1 Tax=Ixodes ricinus TaxID=34613 RepID=A0A6B0U7M0_IXORI
MSLLVWACPCNCKLVEATFTCTLHVLARTGHQSGLRACNCLYSFHIWCSRITIGLALHLVRAPSRAISWHDTRERRCSALP